NHRGPVLSSSASWRVQFPAFIVGFRKSIFRRRIRCPARDLLLFFSSSYRLFRAAPNTTLTRNTSSCPLIYKFPIGKLLEQGFRQQLGSFGCALILSDQIRTIQKLRSRPSIMPLRRNRQASSSPPRIQTS